MTTNTMNRRAGYDASYKILLIGESGVGKTALIKALMGDDWTASHMTTVGIDFVTRLFEVDGAVIQLQIWDTAGQERFRTITRFQYRGTKGLLLVYDISNGSSFSMMNYWLESIDREIDRYSSEPVPVFVVGNKCDLTIQRAVTYEQGKKMADEHFVHRFMETSAKEGINVHVLFVTLAEAIAEIHDRSMLHAYQTKDEKVSKMVRRTSQIFLEAEQDKQERKKMRRNMSRIKLGYEFDEQEPGGKSKDKCSCG